MHIEVAEKAESLADPLAHERGVLADAAGERDRVQAAERRRRGGDRRGHAVDVDGEREALRIELAHVTRGAGESGEPRLVLEGVVELVDREPALPQEIDQGAWVDRARARRHRNALERREAHRRLDRAAVEDGSHGRTAAEVAHDQPGDPHLRRRPFDRQAVEPVAADAPLVPALGHGIAHRLLGHRRVKRRVEDRDVRDVGQRAPAPPRSPAGPARCGAARGA